jgi:light-regulated signal transduction histidine kinase (bacteriophytochrome)
MMPGYDGLSLCRDIKADPATAMIPVVMLTALTHREALLEGWKAGANEYLFKPFHPKELVTRVQSLLKIGQLNETVRRHMLEVEEANKELEAFSYSVSHDLRTPLRTIDGFSKELLDNGENVLDSQSKADLARIRAAVKRMSRLIDDLLEFSHLSRQDLKRERVDLSRLVEEIAQKSQADQPERPVECVVAAQVSAGGDAHLLEIALTNLIQNSFKFTQHASHPRIEFNVRRKDEKTVFYLRDNGVGFNMDYAHQLFKPFQRLHDVKQYPGTGIGLALVQRIIQRHGGRIWVEAEENHGATFYFTLS